MSNEGEIRLPEDEGQEGPKGITQKARDWITDKWRSPNEQTPLLGGVPANRKKLVAAGASLATVLVLLGLCIGYWVTHHDTDNSIPRELTPTERDFLGLPSKENLRDYLKTYTSKTHLAGTPNDKLAADWTHAQFESFGLNSTIETYWPLLNYPVSHRLALISGPENLRYEAKLAEDPVEEDETSKDPEAIPTYHGFSKNGTAQGRVVYANYGRLEDFEFLKSQGIELNGTIALVRYSYIARGHKVHAAHRFGCVGALIYSDPEDDGPVAKDSLETPAASYPNGPWRSKSSVQRGSVINISLNSGDPLTPGYPATENATRIDPRDAAEIPKIPSLPLSWEDALPLLRATQGLGVRHEGWRGGLEDVDYSSGPSEGEVLLVNHVEYKITPIWNVLARIEGSEEERAIVLGNHRDAWAYGAADPSSGSASMMELARALGELLKRGWRPRRTIILASWDGEEFGLIGSTEWVEDHQAWLDKNAAAYINVDSAIKGPFFQAGASPSLNRLIYDVTSMVQDPLTGGSVYEAWSANHNLTDQKPPVSTLGSGSDFVGFLSHTGVASMNLQFAGYYGVYHSNYDSFHWMEKFGDPGFYYHETMVKVWGLLTLRLADSLILPIYPQDYTQELAKYIDSLPLSSSASFKIKHLKKALKKLKKTSRRFERRLNNLSKRLDGYKTLEEIPSILMSRLEKANKRLTYFERGFISEGIPGREWFKHTIYGPGLWTGYSSQEFPAIVDSLDSGNDHLIKHTIKVAAKSIKRAAEFLKMD
ncbi:hypothetical protein G6F56_007508 [Rhizopus delemar]|nr:hypothetical protein G6F56_007508 [Rhizopus delemar]